MEANKFISEVYRRIDLRAKTDGNNYSNINKHKLYLLPWEEAEKKQIVISSTFQYEPLLPANKNIKILDIGFGSGQFIAACINLGYTHIEGAEFGAKDKQNIINWSNSVKEIHDIKEDIGTFLLNSEEKYDIIHMSHVIEHIPKYSLLFNIDSIYQALKIGGKFIVRTPNMESPKSISLLYCCLGHEYGFTHRTLLSLLTICNFDDVSFIIPKRHILDRGKVHVNIAKNILHKYEQFMIRLFGSDRINNFNSTLTELVATAIRKERPPLLNEETR